MKGISLLLALALGGCVADADRLRQACADANIALNGGGQMLLGEMQRSEVDGTAHDKLPCFTAAVESLHSLSEAKDSVCANPDQVTDYKLYIAKAVTMAPQVPMIVSQWRACIASKGGK